MSRLLGGLDVSLLKTVVLPAHRYAGPLAVLQLQPVSLLHPPCVTPAVCRPFPGRTRLREPGGSH